MRFLIDANLPPALAGWLANEGHDAAHIAQVLSSDATDLAILRLAAETGAIILTKDTDFLYLTPATRVVPAVVVRCGNVSLGVLRPWFLSRLPSIISAIEAGERVVEVR